MTKNSKSGELEKAPQTRMNLMIDKSLYRLMKIRAAEEEKSVSEITRELWKNYLK